MRSCSFRKAVHYALTLLMSWMVAWLVIQEALMAHSGTLSAEQVLAPMLTFRGAQGDRYTRYHHLQKSFVIDAVCRGCRHALANPNDKASERCGLYMEQERIELLSNVSQVPFRAQSVPMSSSDTYLSIAADIVAKRYPLGCSRCRVSTTDDRRECDRLYWLYDAAAPRIRASHTQPETWFPHSLVATKRTLTRSLPHQRLPPKAFDNLTSYFSNPNNVYPKAEYFMEYNPSIVILPPHVSAIWHQDDTFSTHLLYMASFRISNQNYCFRPMDRKLMQGSTQTKATPLLESKDYLGLVILNATDWTIVADTIVDINRANVSLATKGQDYRLVVLRHQLYLSSNDWIVPLWLRHRGDSWPSESKTAVTVPTVFEISATSKLQVAIGHSVACAPCNQKTNRGSCGKNFNYFVIPTNSSVSDPVPMNDNAAYVEIWPTGPHMVRAVQLNQPCQRHGHTTTYVDDNTHAPSTSSFATTEEIDFPALGRRESILTRGRGGACCISMPYGNRTLLVGIQHSKTPSQGNRKLPTNVTSNHYLSSLYAFEATEPFRIVAQSGWFCLGFPTDNDDGQIPPLVSATKWRRLSLGNTQAVLECPRIHFVSGLTLKANDPNSVIIAYGINDCLSRFVEVRLSDLEVLLFQGPEFPTK